MVGFLLLAAGLIMINEGRTLLKARAWKELIALLFLLGSAFSLVVLKILGYPSPLISVQQGVQGLLRNIHLQ